MSGSAERLHERMPAAPVVRVRGIASAVSARASAAAREPFYVAAVSTYLVLLLVALASVVVSGDVDTPAYRLTSTYPLTSSHFWGGGRAWLTPLEYKLFGSGGGAIAAQSLVGALCWIATAAAVARSVGGPTLRRVAFGAVLLLSLSYNVLQWDQWLSSDALSLSLGVLVFGLALEAVRRPTTRSVTALSVAAFLWASDRDSNAALALLLLAVFGIVLLARRFRRLGLTLIAAGLLTFALSTVSVNNDHRWDYGMLDVVSHRILPSPSATSFFVAHGMPLSSEIARWKGEQAGTFWHEFYGSPAVVPFRTWFFSHMKATYLAYIASHPVGTLQGGLGDMSAMLSPNVQEYQAPSLQPVLPPLAESIVYPRDTPTLLFLTVLVASFGVIMGALSRRRVWLVPLVFALSTVPHAVAIWVGEPLNIDKHAITLALLYRLTMLVAALLVVDTALARRAKRAAGTAIPGSR